MSDSQDSKVRIDKWLWAARFFKTRSLASDAINGGHVHLNGARVKPSKMVLVGDTVRVQRGVVEMVMVVEALSDKRGPAKVAQTLYKETDESREVRERQAEQYRLLAQHTHRPEKKPNKRDRRHIIRFTRRQD